MSRLGPYAALSAGLWLSTSSATAEVESGATPAPVEKPAAAPVESPRAFVLERLLELARLEKLEARAEMGAPLTGVRQNLQAAELVLAEFDDARATLLGKLTTSRRAQETERAHRALLRFESLRAEISAQMDYIDALLSRTELDQALVQAEAQRAQTQLVLNEAEAKAQVAEAAARQAAPASKE